MSKKEMTEMEKLIFNIDFESNYNYFLNNFFKNDDNALFLYTQKSFLESIIAIKKYEDAGNKTSSEINKIMGDFGFDEKIKIDFGEINMANLTTSYARMANKVDVNADILKNSVEIFKTIDNALINLEIDKTYPEFKKVFDNFVLRLEYASNKKPSVKKPLM